MYLLINYGDFVDGTKTKAPPYVQLLSTTDPASAHLDFVNIRLGGTDTTGNQMLSSSTTSSPDDIDAFKTPHDTKKTVIGVVIGSVLFVAIAFIVYFMYKRRHRRHLVSTADFSSANMGSYRPLQLAAPPGEEVGHAWARDFHPEDLYDPAASQHGMPLGRYGETAPRNTR